MAEHILQISVSVDDQTIIRLAEESAAKQLVDKVLDEERTYGTFNRTRAIMRIRDDATRQIIDEVINNHIDDISQIVADKLSRSKAFRAKTAELVSEKISE